MRTSLWIVPGGSAAVAMVLARGLPIIEARIPHGESAWYLFPGQAESARLLLSTIASSMMSLTGLVFSITILVLQLASSQFSPRVLHTFLADSSTRRAMGCFVGTFVYAMALLPEVRGSEALGGERVPAFSVFFAFVMVIISVGIFVQYIHGMANSIRAVHVLRRVAEEAAESMVRLYAEGTTVEPPAAVLPSAAPDQVVCNARVSGVLAAVDDDALFAAACEAKATIELVPMLGDFVVRGGTLLRVWGQTRVDPEQLREHLALADERTPTQDPAFAFRQLVDIAERALSPGINDPTTAVQAIDRIHDLLTVLANRSFPATARVDDSGALRLVFPRPDWDALVHLAFDEIRQYGAGSIQVTRRLRAALQELRAICPPHRRGALDLQRRELDLAVTHFSSVSDRARSMEPSHQGQGQPQRAGRSARHEEP